MADKKLVIDARLNTKDFEREYSKMRGKLEDLAKEPKAKSNKRRFLDFFGTKDQKARRKEYNQLLKETQKMKRELEKSLSSPYESDTAKRLKKERDAAQKEYDKAVEDKKKAVRELDEFNIKGGDKYTEKAAKDAQTASDKKTGAAPKLNSAWMNVSETKKQLKEYERLLASEQKKISDLQSKLVYPEAPKHSKSTYAARSENARAGYEKALADIRKYAFEEEKEVRGYEAQKVEKQATITKGYEFLNSPDLGKWVSQRSKEVGFSAAQDEVIAVQNDIEAAQKAIADLDAKIEATHQKYQKSTAEASQRSRDYSAKLGESANAERDVQTREEIAAAEKESGKLQASIDEATAKLKKQTEEAQRLKSEYGQISQAAAAASANVGAVQQQRGQYYAGQVGATSANLANKRTTLSNAAVAYGNQVSADTRVQQEGQIALGQKIRANQVLLSQMEAALRSAESSGTGLLDRVSARVHKVFATLGSAIKRVLVFQMVRKFFNMLFQYAGQLYKQNTMVSSAISNLKASFYTAATTILNAIAPAVTFVINLLSRLFSLIGGFVSLITGKSVGASYAQAKALNATASAAGGASKALKDEADSLSLLDFDTLNQIQSPQDDTGGGGGGGGGGFGFGEEPAEGAGGKWTEMLQNLYRAVSDLVKALADLFKYLWDNFLGPIAETIGESVLTLFTDGIERLTTFIEEHKEEIAMFVAILMTIGGAVLVIMGVWKAFQLLVGIVKILIGFLSTPLGIITAIAVAAAAMITFVLAKAGLIEPAITALKDFITNIIKAVTAFLTGDTDKAKEYMSAAWEAFKKFWGVVWDAIKIVAKQAWEKIKQFAKSAWEKIKEVWGTVKQWFVDHVLNPVKQFFSNTWEAIKAFPKNAWEFIKGIWATVKQWFTDTVLNPLKDKFSEIFGKIRDKVHEVADNIKQKWQNIADAVKGFWDGVKQKVEGIIEGIKSTFSGAVTWIAEQLNKIPGVNIPVTVTAPSGSYSSSGYNKSNTGKAAKNHPLARAATGAVIPGGKEFLAIYGDQRHGQTNLEAPDHLIYDLAKKAVQDSGLSGGNQPINITLKVNGSLAKIARDLRPALESENRRVGSSILVQS